MIIEIVERVLKLRKVTISATKYVQSITAVDADLNGNNVHCNVSSVVVYCRDTGGTKIHFNCVIAYVCCHSI